MLMSRLAELLKLAEHVLSCCTRFEYSCLQTSWRFILSFWPAGAKEVPMSYVQHALHAKNKLGYGEDEILKKWNEHEDNEDILRDQLGPRTPDCVSTSRREITSSEKTSPALPSSVSWVQKQGGRQIKRWRPRIARCRRTCQGGPTTFRTGSATGAARNLAVEQTTSVFEY